MVYLTTLGYFGAVAELLALASKEGFSASIKSWFYTRDYHSISKIFDLLMAN